MKLSNVFCYVGYFLTLSGIVLSYLSIDKLESMGYMFITLLGMIYVSYSSTLQIKEQFMIE